MYIYMYICIYIYIYIFIYIIIIIIKFRNIHIYIKDSVLSSGLQEALFFFIVLQASYTSSLRPHTLVP